MELIKRKILLEDNIDRTYNSSTWGEITATTFYINVMLTQNIDDIGLFTDILFIPSGGTNNIPDYTILIDKLTVSGYTFPFMDGILPQTISGITKTEEITLRIPSKSENEYYNFGNLQISGNTDSKLDDVKTYNAITPYISGFTMNVEPYIAYNNVAIVGVDMVKSLEDPIIYVFDTPNDINLGTTNQIYGLRYLDYSGETRDVVINSEIVTIPLTTVNYIGEGFNETNTSLSALTKEEYLFGIISPPEIQSDIFIERGATTVMDMHLRLSETKNLGQLVKYGNGFYNLNKQ